MLLSVFTPCYNSSPTLERCYISLCSQTYKYFEWILVDDNSNDNGKTKLLIEEIKAKASFPVKCLFMESNSFGAQSMYEACQIAQGKYIVLFDHDDELFDITLERIAFYINTFCSKEIVAVRPKCVNEDWAPIGKPYKKELYIAAEGFIRYKIGMMQELMLVGNTEVLKKISKNMKPGFTYAFVAAEISKEYKIVYPDEALRIYHMNVPTSFTNNSETNLKFPNAKVELNFLLWNAYSKYLIYKPLQTLKDFIHTAAMISKYKIKYNKSILKKFALKLAFFSLYPIGVLKATIYKRIGKRI